MKHAEEQGPWLMVPNRITGRTEVYAEDKEGEKLVGSMPGNPTDEQLSEMMRRLEAEAKV